MGTYYSKILDATLDLVNENSYHGTSINMIAEKLNISKSTVFYHFKSKESILLTLFEETAERVKEQARLILDDKDLTGKEKLRKWTRSYLDELETVGNIIKVYLRESRFISSESKAVFKERQKFYVNFIVNIIQQIQEEDEQAFGNLDPKIVARSIIGMLNSVANWFDFKGKISTEEFADIIYEMISASFQKP